MLKSNCISVIKLLGVIVCVSCYRQVHVLQQKVSFFNLKVCFAKAFHMTETIKLDMCLIHCHRSEQKETATEFRVKKQFQFSLPKLWTTFEVAFDYLFKLFDYIQSQNAQYVLLIRVNFSCRCEDNADGSLSLHYYTIRPGLYPIVLGNHTLVLSFYNVAFTLLHGNGDIRCL